MENTLNDKWINVTEKLPEEYEPVLVYHVGNYPKGYNNMQTAYWRNDGIDGEIEVEWLNADSGFSNNNTVSHWMYLPELPINK